MKKLVVSGLLALAALSTAAVASAQDFSLPATYGTTSLSTGFTPDPLTVPLTAGGSIAVSQPGCTGNVAAAPDYELTYTAGSTFPLNFYVKAGSDTTLLINAPDGTWHCNDDANGFNPWVTFATPQSGTYDIWVGTYATSEYPQAELSISELAPVW